VLLFLVVQLRWRELLQGRRWALSISFNKAGLFFLWRFSTMVLFCGTRRSPAVFLVMPSRWWSGGCSMTGETYLNKKILL
jgi:hypothetical protein